MRENSKIRERYELSLDGKQVASVVVGALVVLGAVFVLGLNVGKQLGARAQAPGRAENPLAALDRPPAPAADPREKEPKLSFHDALTKGPAESSLPAPASPPVAPAASNRLPAPPTLPAAAPAAPPASPPASPSTSTPPAGPAAAPKPRKDPMTSAVAKVAALPAAAGGGAFSVQVGATQSEPESRRLQKKFAGEGARIAAADVPGKGRWYRVKVGAYATRAEAEKRLAALRSRGIQGFVTAGH